MPDVSREGDNAHLLVEPVLWLHSKPRNVDQVREDHHDEKDDEQKAEPAAWPIAPVLGVAPSRQAADE